VCRHGAGNRRADILQHEGDIAGSEQPRLARGSVRPLTSAERDLLPDAMLFGALAYVLAPWEDRVYTGNWRRARTVIDERGKIEALIGA
jgi:hypothetical protein